MPEPWQQSEQQDAPLEGKYDDPLDPSELTIFDREDTTTRWLTAEAGFVFDLEVNR